MLESSKTYDTDTGFHSLMAILPLEEYETLASKSIARRALKIYATAGASPKALAYGLGTAFFACTK